MNIPALFSVLIFSFFSTKAFGETYFSPNNCEFSVSFPSHYEAQYGYGPSGARFDIASWAQRGSFLKAECAVIKRQDTLQEHVRNTLTQAAKAFGLYGFTVTLSGKNAGKIATLTGYKNIEELNVTYQISFFAGPRTALIVYTGAESRRYPTQEISRFINSVESAQK